MRKNILLILSILIIAFVSCENKKGTQTDSTSKPSNEAITDSNYSMVYELKNDSIQIIVGINRIDSLNISFGIEVKKKGKTESMKGTAALIRLEDENGIKYIPEGTAIEDENQKKDYFCDSTYFFSANRVSLGFGFEEDAKKRLCLTRRFDNQNLEFLTNMYYTLYRRE